MTITLFRPISRNASQALMATAFLAIVFPARLLLPLRGASSPTTLQQAVDRAFAGQPGAAAVVVRVRDNSVLAAHNVPVLRRRIATPGSAIKPFVLQLLLETNAIRSDDSIACRRDLTIAGRKLSCSHAPELTSFKADEALAFSCNSYFVTAAERIKPGVLEQRFQQLGFTQPSGLLPKEGQGHISNAKSVAERQLLAIGVAGIEITPLELAAAYLKLARVDAAGASLADKVVLAGLREATDYGLARNAKPDELTVAGKTGTASDRSSSHTHAWFAGFAPAEKPEIVVVVFVERGHGGVEAANLAHAIFQAYEKNRL